MEKHEIYSGLIVKIAARCFLCSHEGRFRIYFPLFWEAKKYGNQTKNKLALAARVNKRNILAENDLQNKNVIKDELFDEICEGSNWRF